MKQCIIDNLNELAEKRPEIWGRICNELKLAHADNVTPSMMITDRGYLTDLHAAEEELLICKALLNIGGEGTALDFLLAVALDKVE